MIIVFKNKMQSQMFSKVIMKQINNKLPSLFGAGTFFTVHRHIPLSTTYMQFLAARSRWTYPFSARCSIPLATPSANNSKSETLSI